MLTTSTTTTTITTSTTTTTTTATDRPFKKVLIFRYTHFSLLTGGSNQPFRCLDWKWTAISWLQVWLIADLSDENQWSVFNFGHLLKLMECFSWTNRFCSASVSSYHILEPAMNYSAFQVHNVCSPAPVLKKCRSVQLYMFWNPFTYVHLFLKQLLKWILHLIRVGSWEHFI